MRTRSLSALCAAAAFTLIGSVSQAMPIAPSGSDPAGAGPDWLGFEAYATAGLPGSGLGVDLGLGRTRVGGEVAWLYPNALRPELHARIAFEPGRLVLAPRLALAWSEPLGPTFGSAPAGASLELTPGLTVALREAFFTPFADVGLLAALNPLHKQQARLYGTAAVGARFALSDQLSLSAHAGAVLGARAFGPSVGITLGWLVGGED